MSTDLTLRHLQNIVRSVSRHMALDPALLASIVAIESDFDPFAVRYEPAFYAKYVVPLPRLSATEKPMRAMAFGLCQVMGQTARELGFDGRYLTALLDPALSVIYGGLYFKQCMKATGNEIEPSLLRYNGGADGSYARKVMARYPGYVFLKS